LRLTEVIAINEITQRCSCLLAERRRSFPSIATSAPLIATTFRSTERTPHVTPPATPPVRAAYELREANSTGLWARVRRGLLGVGKPLLED